MGKDLTKVKQTVFACNGGSCKKKGAEESLRELRCSLKMNGMHETTHTVKSYCVGQCENAPVMFVEGSNTWFKSITPDKIDGFVEVLNGSNEMSQEELYRRDWDEMKPAKVITPKTFSNLEWEEDSEFGQINSIKIYAWEFNTYPLLKECFSGKWNGLRIISQKHGMLSGSFDIFYEKGNAFISQADFTLRIIMTADKASPEFPYKINRIKLFHNENKSLFGLHFSNLEEGEILKVHWEEDNGLWNHLLENYARISS